MNAIYNFFPKQACMKLPVKLIWAAHVIWGILDFLNLPVVFNNPQPLMNWVNGFKGRHNKLLLSGCQIHMDYLVLLPLQHFNFSFKGNLIQRLKYNHRSMNMDLWRTVEGHMHHVRLPLKEHSGQNIWTWKTCY